MSDRHCVIVDESDDAVCEVMRPVSTRPFQHRDCVEWRKDKVVVDEGKVQRLATVTDSPLEAHSELGSRWFGFNSSRVFRWCEKMWYKAEIDNRMRLYFHPYHPSSFSPLCL